MIELKNINKSFGEKQVLKNINITCEPGKCNLIIGASGGGKSVTLKNMVGLLEPDSGSIIYNGVDDFTKMSEKERKTFRQDFGMLFQGSALFDSQTVEENVMFPLAMFGNMPDSEKMDRVNYCLQRVNLVNANKLFPAELSGGMKKRVAIARAITMNPKYLFCDEPNSGLDPKTSALIDELIKDITDEFKTTTVVITHDMNSVIEIGDNITYLYQGEVWWQGSNKQVLDTDNAELNDFIYASKLLKNLKKK